MMKSSERNEISKSVTEKNQDAIAIIGFSGRFPEAADVEQYWDNLVQGRDCVGELKRWNLDEFYDPTGKDSKKSYSKWGGMLEQIDQFDSYFFNISPKQSELMEPRQRLFLEEVWRTFETAGYTREDMDGLDCGVYLGCEGSSDYFNNVDQDKTEINMHYFLGNSNSVLASRIAYYANLTGPSLTIDTACSSSLVAVHLACASLRNKECKLAIAGGVSIYTKYTGYILMSGMKALSPTGKCRAFDNDADGFVPGEGIGAVLLKPLEDALNHGDTVYGIIRGDAINQDGRTNGITAPSAASQSRLESEVYNRYQINPESISYIEAHGTGTKLGDPIEIAGLKSSFAGYTDKKNFCGIGSVKSNIGHLGAASGIASVIKVLMAFMYKQLPPTIHFNKLNDQIRMDNSPFYIVNQLQEWQISEGKPRRAAISAFGHSGTNCHMVLEEPGIYLQNDMKYGCYLLPISALNDRSLELYLRQLLRWIKYEATDRSMDEIEYTLFCGRNHYNKRCMIISANKRELAEQITKLLNHEKTDKAVMTGTEEYTIEEDQTEQLASFLLFRKLGKSVDEISLKIAYAFVNGATAQYRKVFPSTKNHLVLMPGYAYDTTSYWICENDKATGALRHAIHPLVGENISTIYEQKYRTIFTGDEYFIRDHKIMGNRILPASAYLEMIRMAGTMSIDSDLYVIQNLVFEKSIQVKSKPIVIDITVNSYADRKKLFHTEIADCSDGNVRYANADFCIGTCEVSGTGMDIQAFIASAERYEKGESLYQLYDDAGYAYGESFRVVKDIYRKDGETLSLLENNTGYLKTPMFLNPTMLDGAFQTVLTICANDEKSKGIPYFIKEIRIYDQIPEKCYAYVRKSARPSEKKGIKNYDITILTVNGQKVIDVKDFTTVSIRQNEKQPMEDILIMVRNGEIEIEDADVILGRMLNA